MRSSVTGLLAVIALSLLAGCGQTGPLYMPVEDAPVPPPAAPQDSTKQPSQRS
ncbi:MAG: lipoprotein [Halioglobus sp.]|nr:lipoprotein [Halioglobus sp.]